MTPMESLTALTNAATEGQAGMQTFLSQIGNLLQPTVNQAPSNRPGTSDSNSSLNTSVDKYENMDMKYKRARESGNPTMIAITKQARKKRAEKLQQKHGITVPLSPPSDEENE
jgi:hypothetical protein